MNAGDLYKTWGKQEREMNAGTGSAIVSVTGIAVS
jgi:hypothetical protein